MNFKLKNPVFLQFHTTIFISITKTSTKTSCTPFFLIATNARILTKILFSATIANRYLNKIFPKGIQQ